MNLNLLGSMTIYNPYFITFTIFVTVLIGIYYLISSNLLSKSLACVWSMALFMLLLFSIAAPKSYEQTQKVYDTSKALPMVVDQADVLVVDGVKLPVTITGKNEVYGVPVSRLTVRHIDAQLKTSNKIYKTFFRHHIHRYEIVDPDGRILASYDTKTFKTTGEELFDTLLDTFTIPLVK